MNISEKKSIKNFKEKFLLTLYLIFKKKKKEKKVMRKKKHTECNKSQLVKTITTTFFYSFVFLFILSSGLQ